MANFFEEAVKLYNNPKAVANWLLGEIAAYLNENKKSMDEIDFMPAQLAELLQLIEKGTISGKIAKTVIVQVLKTGKSVKDVVAESGMTQISNEDEVIKIIREVLANNPKPVQQYKEGKKTTIGFLVGQVMKASKGRANPGLANKLLKQELEA